MAPTLNCRSLSALTPNNLLSALDDARKNAAAELSGQATVLTGQALALTSQATALTSQALALAGQATSRTAQAASRTAQAGATAIDRVPLPDSVREALVQTSGLAHLADPVVTRLEDAGSAAQASVLGAVQGHVHPAMLASVGLAPTPVVPRAEPVDPARVSTLPRTLAYRASATPNADAFYFPDASGGYQMMTWKMVADRVRDLAGGLHAHGLERGDRVAILANTRVEWVLADLAISGAGGVTTAIYPSSSSEQLAHILKDSGSRVVFVENDEQRVKVESIRDQLRPDLRIVQIEGGAAAGSLATLEASGKAWNAASPGRYEALAEAVAPDDLATLIYTSGTTGVPKGVELTHDAWAAQQEAAVELGFLSSSDKHYLWLPLSHSFGKFLEAATVRLGIPTVIDGRPDQIGKGIAETHPTFLAGVPRVFEKIYNGVLSKAKESGGVKYEIFKWAMSVGLQVSRLRQNGREPDLVLATQYAIADALVFSKIRDKMGGNIRFLLSGGAPLEAEIAETLHAVGLIPLEGYGLTETSGASLVNRPNDFAFGSVGRAIPGVEVKLEESGERKGEILLRGRALMRGYHNLPAETAKELTPDGFFRTGDIGTMDARGHVRITDRLKNIFKLSTGDFVTPQAIENGLKLRSGGLISQVLVHGYNRKFCSALITLDEAELKKFAGRNGLSDLDYKALTEHPDVQAEVQGVVNQVNRSLQSSSRVRKFFIPPADFTEKSGELTASMKVKRKDVEAHYKAQLDAFYVEDGRA